MKVAVHGLHSGSAPSECQKKRHAVSPSAESYKHFPRPVTPQKRVDLLSAISSVRRRLSPVSVIFMSCSCQDMQNYKNNDEMKKISTITSWVSAPRSECISLCLVRRIVRVILKWQKRSSVMHGKRLSMLLSCRASWRNGMGYEDQP